MRFSLAQATKSAEESKGGKERSGYDGGFFASVGRRLHDYVFLRQKELDELAQGSQRIEQGCERVGEKLQRMIDGASPKSVGRYRRRLGVVGAIEATEAGKVTPVEDSRSSLRPQK